RLGVEAVLVSQPAGHEDLDHALGGPFAAGVVLAIREGRPGAERQPDARPEGPPQQPTSRGAVLVHGRAPRARGGWGWVECARSGRPCKPGPGLSPRAALGRGEGRATPRAARRGGARGVARPPASRACTGRTRPPRGSAPPPGPRPSPSAGAAC